MKRRIRVFTGEDAREIGSLRFETQGNRESASFQYNSSWLASPGRYAIDPALPLVSGPQFHKKTIGGSVFHSAIADTEPDGWAKRVILRDHARRRMQARRSGERGSSSALDSLDFLLAVDDTSRVGALRFQDEHGTFQRDPGEGRRGIPPLIELDRLIASTRAVEANEETQADLEYLQGKGTSLGGMRPKCTVIDEEDRLSIGKFPSVGDERAVTRGEVLAMSLARRAGIDAADARLIESAGTPVALIRRFDRREDGSRLMYISAATFIGAERGGTDEHAYTEFVDGLRVNGAAAQTDIEELWRRIAFSILITNVDDHLFNHGFLHAQRGLWRLAPAFDLNPFPERLRELKTWISEETGPVASIEALLSVRAYFRVSVDRSKEILDAVERAVSRWRNEGGALGMTALELDAYADAFEHEERRAARRAAG